MLELKEITKVYPAGGEAVHALKGINLQFRENEFVSILGPSGCGKTTMLNIIGGLDQYTSGDLVINGTSTKEYKDRDWDAYRNHSVGFVFQSYNLIPHQTVLQNVELALTLSGVSKAERRKRAKEALEKVGLSSQLKKKPAEMSGGQMQRVAIARAIVNNPDIILADEPTGALDTETSIQVMNILKEISKDRLVIMVTHNPELAERYSTRIVRMLDGEIQDDTKPIREEELQVASKQEEIKALSKGRREKKPSMSFFTSFGLSLKNLFSKKGRTILTAFAGSIGIIGIALIYAVSNGMTAYIDAVQEETLSSYPITLEASEVDIGSLMRTFMGRGGADNKHEMDAVYSQSSMVDMLNALNNLETNENDLRSFKAYLESELKNEENQAIRDAVNGILCTYDFDLLVYTQNVDGDIIYSDTETMMTEAISKNYGVDSSVLQSQNGGMGMGMGAMSVSAMGGSTVLWEEMLAGVNGELINPLVKDQYDVLYGSWPTGANEVVLVVNSKNEIDDMTLYALGLESKEYIDEVFTAVREGGTVDVQKQRYTYEEICDLDFRVILNADCYEYDATKNAYIDIRESSAGLKYLYDNAYKIKVVGVIKPNEDATSHMLRGTIAYTKLLTEYVVHHANESEPVKAQLADSSKDIFTNLPFKENTGNLSEAEKADYFRKRLEDLTVQEEALTYISIKSIPSDEWLSQTVDETMDGYSTEAIRAMAVQTMAEQLNMSVENVASYIDAMSDEDIVAMFRQSVEESVKQQYAASVTAQMSAFSADELSGMLKMEKSGFSDRDCAKYYDEILEFSQAGYEGNLKALGYVELDNPSSISIFASSFENKDVISDFISEYNEGVDELKKITYTDYIGLMLSSMTTIINAITYVLIAFVAISLVVSSIMIGVITLISVQERTKEIGILRAIGASKRNVSSMFNAETLIIGFASGLLGVAVTYILCFPINAIIQHLSGISNIEAVLPIGAALILIGISMILTLISGIIPSRSAAKKDPVVALRTE